MYEKCGYLRNEFTDKVSLHLGYYFAWFSREVIKSEKKLTTTFSLVHSMCYFAFPTFIALLLYFHHLTRILYSTWLSSSYRWMMTFMTGTFLKKLIPYIYCDFLNTSPSSFVWTVCVWDINRTNIGMEYSYRLL